MYIELNMDRSGQDFLNCISIVSHKCLILITTKAFAPFIASAIRKTYQREILIQERRLDYWYGSCGGGISGGPLKPQKTWFWTFLHKRVYLEKQLPFFWWKFPWPWSCWWASLGTAVIFGVDGFCYSFTSNNHLNQIGSNPTYFPQVRERNAIHVFNHPKLFGL